MGERIKALCLAACLLLAGCAGPAQPAAVPSAPPEETLTLSLAGEPRTLDPAFAAAPDELTMLAHLFEGLMKWSGGGAPLADGVEAAQVVPGMAERCEKTAGADGQVTYTFHLRPAAWWDGKPVTAQDFVYAWRRLATPWNGADYAWVLNWVARDSGQSRGSDLAIRAVDEATFQVTLTQDVPWFLELCALPATAPLRQDVIGEYGDGWTGQPETLLSNGPYRLRSWTHNESVVLERNPAYYARTGGPDALCFLLQTQEAETLADFQAGVIDFLQGVTVAGREPTRLPCLSAPDLAAQPSGDAAQPSGEEPAPAGGDSPETVPPPSPREEALLAGRDWAQGLLTQEARGCYAAPGLTGVAYTPLGLFLFTHSGRS